MEFSGVGVLTATALVAAVGDAGEFPNGQPGDLGVARADAAAAVHGRTADASRLSKWWHI